MQQFDMNGPEGKGKLQIDPSTGKKLKYQATLADEIRNTAGASVTLKEQIQLRQKQQKEAGM